MPDREATMQGTYYEPTARKAHRCIWCGETIPVGEKHQQYRGKWEGDWQNWRMHNECQRAFMRSTDGEGGMIDPYVNVRGRRSAS